MPDLSWSGHGPSLSHEYSSFLLLGLPLRPSVDYPERDVPGPLLVYPSLWVKGPYGTRYRRVTVPLDTFTLGPLVT